MLIIVGVADSNDLLHPEIGNRADQALKVVRIGVVSSTVRHDLRNSIRCHLGWLGWLQVPISTLRHVPGRIRGHGLGDKLLAVVTGRR